MKNQTGVIVQSLINASEILLVNNEKPGDAINAYLRDTRGTNRDYNMISTWISKFSTEDLQKLESEGITKAIFQEINTTAKNLRKQVFLPSGSSSSAFGKLSIIYYQNKVDVIKRNNDKLKQIYNDCDNDIKYESIIITRDFGGRNKEDEIIELYNPLYLIQRVTSIIDELTKEINNNYSDVPMKSFIFSSEFKLLSSFCDDIKNKGLNDDELEQLNYYWSLLIVKGFALNQVKVKLSMEEINYIKNEGFDNREKTVDEIQKYSEINNLVHYFNGIFTSSDDINDESLNQIYQNHSNDDVTPVLKPFIEKLIPYYKSLITPEGFLKLTFQISDEYQNYINDMAKGYHMYNNKAICLLYYNYIPFKLINPPNESYEEILKLIVVTYFKSTLYFLHVNDNEKNIPKESESEEENLDTLTKQKYYIANYLVAYMNSKNMEFISLHDCMLLLSLLDWKIDVDCKEARDLEDYFKNTVKLNLKNYDWSYSSSRSYLGLKHFAKYIIKTVSVAEQPLDQNEMKKELQQCLNDGINEKSISSKCCYLI